VQPLGSVDDEPLGSPEQILAPGLSDAHVHLVAAAAARAGLDLSTDPPASAGALLARLREHAASLPGETWLRASGYDETFLAERRHPTREELDRAATGRAVRLRHATRHASVLSTAALARAESALGPLSADVAPRDESGRPSGLVIGMEDELTAVFPALERGALESALAAVARELLARGVVCLDEITASNDAARVALLADQVEAGRLPQRVRAWVRDAEEAEPARRAARGLVEIAGVKLLPRSTEDVRAKEFRDRVCAARRRGLPLAVHAVEPDVTDAVLDVLASAPPRGPGAGAGVGPDRIEHASLCPPHLARRLAAARVAVVTQPAFLVSRGAKYEREIEEPLWPWLYPIRSLREAGVLVAAGSDAPVAPIDPRVGFAGATTRRSATGTLLGGEERLAPWEALDLFTSAAARVRGEETGDWLVPGRRADLALLASDPCEEGLASWSAVHTVIGGRPFAGESGLE